MELLGQIAKAIGDIFNTIGTTKEYWVYALFGLIGLYSNLYWTIKEENRSFKLRKDIGAFMGQFPFVLGAVLLIDNSPWVSLIVGFIPERIGSFLKKKGLSMIMGKLTGLITDMVRNENEQADTAEKVKESVGNNGPKS